MGTGPGTGPGRSSASGPSRSPPAPPARPVRGLPADFSRQAGHPAASSGARSTHFFGGSGSSSAGGDQSRTSRSPPVGRQTDDGGLSDFLGSSGPQSQGRTGGAGTAASGGGGDRYGLFTAAGDAGSGSVGGSRVAQSRARYNTLFGEEEQKSSNPRRNDMSARRRQNAGSLFDEN
ncbi:unnamed protein product [Sphacelaria rigidula]